MILLDTDVLSLYFAGHNRIIERVNHAEDAVATTVVSRIEVLEGRFASVLKAEDGERLLRSQQRLQVAEEQLAPWQIVPFNEAAAAEFDKLREIKKLKKIGRPDLLIAAIALANRATLVTRNVKHFQQVHGLHVENWAD